MGVPAPRSCDSGLKATERHGSCLGQTVLLQQPLPSSCVLGRDTVQATRPPARRNHTKAACVPPYSRAQNTLLKAKGFPRNRTRKGSKTEDPARPSNLSLRLFQHKLPGVCFQHMLPVPELKWLSKIWGLFLRVLWPSHLGREKGSGGQWEGYFWTFPPYYQDSIL